MTRFVHPSSIPAALAIPKLNGVLGNDILASFRTIVDFHHRKLILEPIDPD